ncbi:integrase [Rhodococcus fascians]|nr:integrase [Rhodococcus fascians]
MTVQKALGHSSPNVTLSTYAHLWPNADDRTRQTADAMSLEANADGLRTGTRKTADDQEI